MIYLDVEIKKRDLLSRVYLACLLADVGSTVLVGRRLSAREYRRRYPKSLVVRKNARLSGLGVVSELTNCGVIVVSLDEEGFMVDSLEIYVKFDVPHEMVRLVSKFFLWGPRQKAALTDEYGSEGSKFLSCGNPRVILWKNKYFGYFESDINNLKATYGNFVLVSSNFGLVTNSDFVSKNIGYATRAGEGTFSAIFDGRSKTEKTVFLAFIEMCRRLSQSGKTVVFRPHPSDNVEYIKECFYDSNVIVDSSNDIAPWLLACDALIHNCCSSGLEAFLMGVRVIAYEPSGVSLLKDRSVNDLGPVAYSFEELVDTISGDPALVSGLDGRDPSLGNMVNTDPNVVDLVGELLQSERVASNEPYAAKRLLRNRSRAWLCCMHLPERLKQFLLTKLCPKSTQLGARRAAYAKFPITPLREVDRFVECLKERGLVSRDITCSLHDRNCFKLEKGSS